MNKAKLIMMTAAVLAASATYAQDSYDAQNFTNGDLNGTARFVGMGGALGALGGDISVMSTNPAGVGLYKGNDISFTLGGLITGKGAMGHDGSRMSLDQGGLVISFDTENAVSKGLQYVNIGLNYQKKRNFLGNIHTDVNNLDGIFSQTHQIADLAYLSNANDYWGTLADLCTPKEKKHGGVVLPIKDEKGEVVSYQGFGAKDAYYERATYGGTSQTDVSLSFNVSDQLFFGASMGVYDVDYSRESFYSELGVYDICYDLTNWYKTKGDGFDIKLGFICRPIEDSPFRFGVTVHTPTWYRLTDANGADLYIDDVYQYSLSNDDYEYKFRTPWKFGVSLGHTIGKSFAIGAEYEVQDLSASKYSDYDDYNNAYFTNINKITEETLKAQHTLKVGMEFKPVDNFAIRLGYNLVSSPFKKDAYRLVGFDSCSTETDYTNWGAINRFTCGVGYRFKGGYFDLAYQYQAQKGDFYAFDDIDLTPIKVNNNRQHLMATLGFRF